MVFKMSNESHALELLQLTTKRKKCMLEIKLLTQEYNNKQEPVHTRLRLIERDLAELYEKL